MAGWFQRLLRRPKQSSGSAESSLSTTTQHPPSPAASSSSSSSSSSCCSSVGADINGPSSARWAKSYDACICHSEGDLELAEELVTYLESRPEGFRCFLQPRDTVPGMAIVTELCDAVRSSHCWVMLITPSFLRDPWCKYQMHQALAEAPAANGRTIPVVKDVEREDYPKELRSLYYIRAALKERTFHQIGDTVRRYLQELCRSSTSGTD
ncbi:toll/interleukin-1 receptor domain-containing adapter protein [Rhea pennata]|uniref:toll/interleukin-1 receptor domain-containing adapter protein n=1 Tax=Rhea pennata TaxID=8795 RepID=UPI002E2733C0